MLPILRDPESTNVPASTNAADVVSPFAVAPPTTVVPVTVSVTPAGICVTCHVAAVVFVYCKPVTVVFAVSALFTVRASDTMPFAPKTAVSAEPGDPVGSQLAASDQLVVAVEKLAPFQTYVVAAGATCAEAAIEANKNNERIFRSGGILRVRAFIILLRFLTLDTDVVQVKI